MLLGAEVVEVELTSVEVQSDEAERPLVHALVLADGVQDTAYARLWARPVRPPEKTEDRPAIDALTKRWNGAG